MKPALFMNRSLVFLSVLVVALVSCRRNKICNEMVKCAPPDAEALFTTFKGFEYKDIDTIIVRRYKAGSDFNTIIDSLVIDSVASGPGYFFLSQPIITGESPNYVDMQIVVPSVGRTYQVTELKDNANHFYEMKVDCSSGKPLKCQLSFISCKVNDTISFSDVLTAIEIRK